MNEGYFKKGEFIEISGGLVGLVTEADNSVMLVQRISIVPSGTYLTNEEHFYSNSPKDYESKYWIKRLKQSGKPLKSFQLKPII